MEYHSLLIIILGWTFEAQIHLSIRVLLKLANQLEDNILDVLEIENRS